MIFFYWFNIILSATLGGSVYATGDWREPLSVDDFGQEVEARWVIAGNNNISSVYVWPVADEGYHFVGFQDSEGRAVELAPSTITSPVEWGNPYRLWVATAVASRDDGIVSGANYYSANPYEVTAVFAPDATTGIAQVWADNRQQTTDGSEDNRQQTTDGGGKLSTVNSQLSTDKAAHDLSGRTITTSRGQIIIRKDRKQIGR